MTPCSPQLAGAMASAAKAAASPAAAERAAAAAFDANLDVCVALGWAHVERMCLDVWAQVRRVVEHPPVLCVLAQEGLGLFGLTLSL